MCAIRVSAATGVHSLAGNRNQKLPRDGTRSTGAHHANGRLGPPIAHTEGDALLRRRTASERSGAAPAVQTEQHGGSPDRICLTRAPSFAEGGLRLAAVAHGMPGVAGRQAARRRWALAAPLACSAT
eukprot:4909434-Prymnesium_polylepis.2